MARYRRSARRRTPIKNTKTYKKGMVQVLLLSIVGVSVALRTVMGRDLMTKLNDLIPGGKA
jgi:hypothetical protein